MVNQATLSDEINKLEESLNESMILPETFTGEDLFKLNANCIPTLIYPIVPKRGLWALVGSSDTGKSMILRQLVISVVKQRPFLGWDIVGKHWKAIYIATEDDNISTSHLLRKQALDVDGLQNLRFHFETENIPEYLEEQLTKEPADLIIADCWADLFGQNLNDSALIRQTLNIYRAIANKHNCSICFLHHTGKRTEKLEPSKNNILSGQGFEAKMRLVIELRTDTKDENTKHLCVVKGNYLGKEYKNSSYVLKFDPDNFLFTNSGERVAFDQLVAPTDVEKRRKRCEPGEIDISTHLIILAKVFKSNNKFKFSELNALISNHYCREVNDGFPFGTDRVTKYRTHLIEQGLIFEHGKDKSPNKFYSLSCD
jgi:AAA domain